VRSQHAEVPNPKFQFFSLTIHSAFFSHYPNPLSLPESLLNPVEAVRCGAVAFVKVEIEGKGTCAAEEAGLRGGVGFQI